MDIAWHARTFEEVLTNLKTNIDIGLSSEEAHRRLLACGPNALPEKKRNSLFLVFLKQFKSPLIYLLFLAAGISFSLGHQTDSFVILAIVILNALVGSFQEGRAERSMESLRQLTTIKVRVLRGASEMVIDARDLVPGDILVVMGGDAVGADARLLEVAALEVAEAGLTGESVPVAKDVLPLSASTLLADRKNMIYAGTHVTSGRGRAVVVATGLQTEVGKIATLTATAEEPDTPLEQKISQFGRTLIWVAVLLFILVMAIGLLRGLPFADILMVSISQVVSVIPEGLPVAMTVALAVGMQRMARRRAIVRRLVAVETLGSTDIICTDKTGTLTRNEMTVTKIVLPEARRLEVTGAGYEPNGSILENSCEVLSFRDESLAELLRAGVICNDARLIPPKDSIAQWKILGDPTEAALLTLAVKGGVSIQEIQKKSPRSAEIPFDSAIKMMAVEVKEDGKSKIYIKGAPEFILELADRYRFDNADRVFDKNMKSQFYRMGEEMAGQALRLLAFAVIDEFCGVLGKDFKSLRGRVRFLGMVGQFDPPRPEAQEAVLKCRAAKIRPIMVTGDHKATGLAVARILGIAQADDLAIDGKELEEFSEADLARNLERISVYARVHPSQKLQIVNAWQSRNAVVAMTGDGVNDAPALAKADVGVAMGITGTEVAKEASKIVITDDNFVTIVHAVEEGRVVYRNLKKLILYLVGTGISEILILFMALLFGYPLPLAAVQILWVNLVADGTMTLPLVMDPPEGDEMRYPPIPRGEAILTKKNFRRMALMVLAMAFSTFGYFAYRLWLGVPFAQVQTETFTLLAVCQWFNALNCRSERRSAFQGIFKNRWVVGGLIMGNLFHIAVIYTPVLNKIFHTVPLPPKEALLIGLSGSLVLWVEEIRKYFVRRNS